ncbi:HpcH/HpaI aldolase/citrate lyase family protein [Chelatococcus asaccharovorans]|uniref:Citrate lyase subunit beta/citryl-CoA lyase n=1 Tax=Chelatococcus asaccharovorans TaxID=28210 RepID=A0A2V3TT47_9HYPH|nr:CoA ester lyase [Chelatococcus asaccharovorans]MBS7708131.1 CoA ester lyase [Chelatococcus asaccharovorans]PXW50699.1 citrate lyase subunit beta/citryl-CoA lyase [Chelatococcus asaccharovorans]
MTAARSWLFIPGDSEKKLGKADATGADALIVDLEDSVAPAHKAEARIMVLAFLKAHTPGQRSAQLYVRINPLDEGALEDLAAVMPGMPDGIMLPKIFGAGCVERLSHYLDAFEAAGGIARGATRIIPVATETPRAALTLAGFSERRLPRLSAMTWGAEDLSTALGATTNLGSDGQWSLVYQITRASVLLAAKAAGVAAIDTLYADFRDDAGLRASCRVGAAEGFDGRIAIHPAQVSAINACFTPSDDDIAHAMRVIAAFDATPDAGTVGLDGIMLDIPHLKQAQAVIAKHATFVRRSSGSG